MFARADSARYTRGRLRRPATRRSMKARSWWSPASRESGNRGDCSKTQSARWAGVAAEEEMKCARGSSTNAARWRSPWLSSRPRLVWRSGRRARTSLRFILTDGNSRIIRTRDIRRRSALLYHARHQPSL